MIKKQRRKPLNLLKIEAVLNRLSMNHPRRQEIQIEHAKYYAGFKGESSLDYYLSDLSSEDYTIFHDLRLPRDKNNKYFFQIDCLVVHPRFCALLEVKNLIGNLYFDHQYDQIIRTRDGIDETFSDPVNQVEAQKGYFAKWLHQNKLPNVPLHTLVVITNSKSFIRISQRYGKNAQKIIRGNDLANTIKNYLDNNNVGTFFIKKDIQKLSSKLIKGHIPQSGDILKKYRIQSKEIKTGVICPNCLYIPLHRSNANWLCPCCSSKSKNAHVQAIQDYALLFGTEVNNKTLREFLHIKSRTSLRNLLLSMNIKPNGTTKAATYTLPLPK